MSIYDCFFDSIAGLRRAEALLEQATRVIANPETWAMGAQETPSYGTFSENLASKIGEQGRNGSGKGGGQEGGGGPVPPSLAALDGLGAGQSQGPMDLLDAMIAAMMAQRMYEANARMIAIENRLVGIIIHLGDERYTPGT